MTAQATLPGLSAPRRRGPAKWYRHTPPRAAAGEGRGPLRVLGVPARWWPTWEAEGMARFLAWEFELGDRVAAALRGCR